MKTYAWLAGLLEGEGYFFAEYYPRKNRPNTYLHQGIVLEMTDEDVVRAAQEFANKGYFMYVKHRLDKPQCKPTFRWKVAKRQDVIDLCREIYPFMGKRRSAKLEKMFETLGESL